MAFVFISCFKCSINPLDKRRRRAFFCGEFVLVLEDDSKEALLLCFLMVELGTGFFLRAILESRDDLRDVLMLLGAAFMELSFFLGLLLGLLLKGGPRGALQACFALFCC